ncbi:MAG TPA: cupin domain-containing protein, partial [Protaetiibacter sp.]|nr:cupin domain-containing protein [Protaetiibacter sp.]
TTVDGAEVGVWEITPGVASDVEEHEVFVVLSGRATITFDGRLEPIAVRAGSVVRLEAGMRTTWTVHETLRKVYVTPAA